VNFGRQRGLIHNFYINVRCSVVGEESMPAGEADDADSAQMDRVVACRFLRGEIVDLARRGERAESSQGLGRGGGLSRLTGKGEARGK
jgi:hypothetical protein